MTKAYSHLLHAIVAYVLILACLWLWICYSWGPM